MSKQVPAFRKMSADAVPMCALKPGQKKAEEQFARTMQKILDLSEFEAPNLTWKSYQNHVSLQDFLGRFR